MAWSTIYGNAQRNSYSGVSTELGALAWTYTFATGEYVFGPPVVSAGGFIWVVVERIGIGFLYNFYLYCIKSDGTLQTKYTLQENGVNPWVIGNLATLSNDVCCVPYIDGILFFPTGAPITPTPPSTLTFLPSSWGVVYNDVLHILASEACNYVIVEAGGGTHTGDGTIDCRYVAPSSSGTYHIIATSIANPTWTATATIWVGSERTIADDSVSRFDAPAVDASDNIYYAWFDDNVGHIKVVTLAPDASFVSEFDTGFRPTPNRNATPLTIDATGMYIPQEDNPHTVTSHTYLNKFSFAGALLWQHDFGLTVSGFARCLTPSVQNGRVAVYGTDGGSFNTTFLINASTGVSIWSHTSTSGDNYSNGPPAPPQDSDGTVYGGIFYNLFGTPRLSQLNAGTGTEQWSIADPDGSSDGPGFPPVIGSDAFVQWPTQSLSRTAKSDGSEQSRLDAIVLDNQPAFITGFAYLTIDGASESQLLAYETVGGCSLTISPTTATVQHNQTQVFTTNQTADFTVTEVGGGTVSPSSGTSTTYTAPSIPGTYHVVATDPIDPTCFDTATITVPSIVSIGNIRARSAGVIAHALLTDLCETALEVYLAGAESGDDLSATAYSLPTVFTLPNPALSGHNYILQLPATDLAKFASGRLGFVKFRYAGNETRDCAGDVVLGGIELIYNEKTVS